MALREHAAAKCGIPEAFLRMMYCGVELKDGHTLMHYNIQKDSTVICSFLDSGAGGAPPIAGDPLILTLTYSYSYLLL